MERRQRERLYGATVAACAEHGYAGMTLSELVRISGVARSDFYRLFSNKKACFLAAVDALYDSGIEQVTRAYESHGGSSDDRLRAAFRKLFELICAEPAAARMCVVELHAAGPEARGHLDRAVERFAAELGRAFGQSETHAGVPKGIAYAIVGGLQMLVHDRLRRGAEAELPGLADDLLAWALSHETPPAPLRRPRTLAPAPPRPPGGRRERLLRAVAGVAANGGYPELRVGKIAARARTSRRALYEDFEGKDDVFLACFDLAVDGALGATQEGYEQGSDWPESIHAANRALLEYLASEPDLARVATVEVLAAGTEALARRDRVIEPFVRMADPGFERAPDLPRIWAEANCFAVYSLIYRQIIRYGARALPRLGPTLTFVDLAPFLGAERAAAVANEPALQVASSAAVHPRPR